MILDRHSPDFDVNLSYDRATAPFEQR